MQQYTQQLTDLMRRLPIDVAIVHADYFGSGDEGDIDEITFVNTEENPIEVSPEIVDELKQLLNLIIESFHPGWEDNDGASGSVDIEVSSRFIQLDHEAYHTASNHSSTRFIY